MLYIKAFIHISDVCFSGDAPMRQLPETGPPSMHMYLAHQLVAIYFDSDRYIKAG